MWMPRKAFKLPEQLLDMRMEIIASHGSDLHATAMMVPSGTLIMRQRLEIHDTKVLWDPFKQKFL